MVAQVGFSEPLRWWAKDWLNILLGGGTSKSSLVTKTSIRIRIHPPGVIKLHSEFHWNEAISFPDVTEWQKCRSSGNIDVVVVLKERKAVTMIHNIPLGTMNIHTKCPGNLASRCQDDLLWIKALDGQADWINQLNDLIIFRSYRTKAHFNNGEYS